MVRPAIGAQHRLMMALPHRERLQMPQLVQTMRGPNVRKKLAPLGAGQVLSVLPDMAVQS